MSIVPVYIPSPFHVFIYFLEGQVYKDSKFGIMTNMGKSTLAKVIFTNIHKISDACANSFSRKMVFLRKLKPIYPSTPQHYHNCSTPTFLILFEKLLAPPPFKKEGRTCILYERLQRRDNKVITILYDRFFIYRTVKS